MAYIKRDEAWETGDEIEFLLGLGSHTERVKNRVVALKNYQQAMRLRVNWGRIDSERISGIVEGMIEREEKILSGKRMPNQTATILQFTLPAMSTN